MKLDFFKVFVLIWVKNGNKGVCFRVYWVDDDVGIDSEAQEDF